MRANEDGAATDVAVVLLATAAEVAVNAASGLGASAVLKFKGLTALPSFVRTGSVFKFKVLTASPSFARNGSAISPKVRTCFSIRHSPRVTELALPRAVVRNKTGSRETSPAVVERHPYSVGSEAKDIRLAVAGEVDGKSRKLSAPIGTRSTHDFPLRPRCTAHEAAPPWQVQCLALQPQPHGRNLTSSVPSAKVRRGSRETE